MQPMQPKCLENKLAWNQEWNAISHAQLTITWRFNTICIEASSVTSEQVRFSRRYFYNCSELHAVP